MDKIIRNAVRTYLIKDGRVVVIKYKSGNKKEGYYDLPGGKIELGETSQDAAIREMKEETTLDIKQLQYKGKMIIEYPSKIINFDVFITSKYEGIPSETEENTSYFMEIEKVLKEEKILTTILPLDRFFIKTLMDNNSKFEMYVKIDDDENILEMNYKVV